MEDYKLNSRQDSYRKCKFTIMETREKYNLSLRKQKLEEIIFKRRIKHTSPEEPFYIEINPETLKIDPNHKTYTIENIENEIESIYEMFTSNDENYKKFAVYLLRNYFLNIEITDNDHINRILVQLDQYSLFTFLLEILSTSTDESMIFEVYWILINIPKSTSIPVLNKYEMFCEDSMIDIYAKHICNQYNDIVENTIWFLCNTIQESVEVRDKLLNSKVFGEIIKILLKDQNSLDLIHQCIWFLSCSMKLTTTTPPRAKMIDILEICSGYLFTEHLEITNQAIWAIYYISQFDEEVQDIHKDIFDSGAVVKLFKLNYKKLQLCIIPCIRILGNLCTGRFQYVDDLLKWNILDFLDSLLNLNKEKNTLREIIWTVCNISAGTVNQCLTVINSPIFIKILECLGDLDYRVRKEAVYVVNVCSSTASLEICNKMVEFGIFNNICSVLMNEKKEFLIIKSLETIYNIIESAEILSDNTYAKIFEEIGGVTLLESLQTHINEDIFKLSKQILTKFYHTQDITDN